MSTPAKLSSKATYVTPPSYWPIVGCVALFSMAVGFVNWLHGHDFGPYVLCSGAVILLYMMFGWFRTVIAESQAGLKGHKIINRSFRWGMVWFIFSEVMFFGAFFGVLWYARVWGVPYLNGEAVHGFLTHVVLFPHFEGVWPLIGQAPDPAAATAPHEAMEAWGLPAINTLILLTSGVTITVAHWGILQNNRAKAVIGQVLTILLGIAFLFLQAHEYGLAYSEKGLTLDAGIYGNVFFMLTGFHGMHVTLGTIMLIVVLFRILKGHFDDKHHFAFEAVSWYWHFVDVVWLLLFVLVYWL